MFYNQPLAHRFGTALASDIDDEKWTRIEVAVAWVRHSGMKHLEDPFRKFLGRGGFAQITVGVDIENTSNDRHDTFKPVFPKFTSSMNPPLVAYRGQGLLFNLLAAFTSCIAL